jgi:hypothetical protein
MLVDDEQPVCELSPDGADEPLGVAVVGPWTSRRNLHDVDASVSENRIKRRRELARPVTNQESKVVRPIVKPLEGTCLRDRSPTQHGQSRLGHTFIIGLPEPVGAELTEVSRACQLRRA